MQRKTLLLLGISYLALIAVIVVIGLSTPPWQPYLAAAEVPIQNEPLDEVFQQQTAESGLNSLEAKIESGTVQPSYQGIPFTPYPVGTQVDEPVIAVTPTSTGETQGY
jgi:hypothetical protein